MLASSAVLRAPKCVRCSAAGAAWASLTAELESVLFAAFLEDIDRGWLQRYPVDDARFAEATNLISRHPEHPLRTLDALHLAQAMHADIQLIATADAVMADAATSMGLEVARF